MNWHRCFGRMCWWVRESQVAGLGWSLRRIALVLLASLQSRRMCFEDLTPSAHSHGSGGRSGDLSTAVSELRSLLMAPAVILGRLALLFGGFVSGVTSRWWADCQRASVFSLACARSHARVLLVQQHLVGRFVPSFAFVLARSFRRIFLCDGAHFPLTLHPFRCKVCMSSKNFLTNSLFPVAPPASARSPLWL